MGALGNSPQIRCSSDRLILLSDLRPHPKNRNTHSDGQISRLAKLFEFQGVRHPIIVSNLSGRIVAGHARLAAAQFIGMTEFPVDYQDFENEEQEYAFLVADNAIAEWATLDLAGINADLQDLGPDFDLDQLGIKDFTLDIAEKEGQCGEDEVPEGAAVDTRCKPGDLWQLGNHRVLCGDSTDRSQVERLMNGEKADMVFTDPPYGMDLDTDYNYMFRNDKRHRDTRVTHSKVIGDDKPYDPSHIFEGFDCDEILLWGADYYRDRIPTGGSWFVWDKRLGDNLDKVIGNCFELCWSKSSHKREVARILWSGHHGMQGDDKGKRVHPTQKPVKLVSWFFERIKGSLSRRPFFRLRLNSHCLRKNQSPLLRYGNRSQVLRCNLSPLGKVYRSNGGEARCLTPTWTLIA